MDLKNKNVLITGATGGIGNDLTKKFYESGANIVASGTNEEKLSNLKKRFNNIHLEKFKLQIELGDNNKKLEGTQNLEQVAQEFESLFVHQMLKSARNAKLAESIFHNDAQDTYQTLLDQEYSKSLAKNHNFGIAESLVRQFGNHVKGTED